jgi:hypothetical protein
VFRREGRNLASALVFLDSYTSDFREGGEVNAAWKHHEGAGVLTGRCDWRSATGRLNG